MILVRTVAELRGALVGVAPARLVPTMGAFHEGHLSLMRMATADGGTVVVSLFVNPTQFNDPRDLDAYPRDETRDAALAESAGCDILFAAPVSEVYPSGPATTVHAPGVSERWEGAHRPGHFDGVATVVAKLFNMVGPGAAYFGEKDWQQCCVVSKMVRDLDFPLELVFGETVREEDGLAMSSRNARLSPAVRAAAPVLFRTLSDMARGFRDGRDARSLETAGVEKLLGSGFESCDYIAIVNAETLDPTAETPARVIGAATIGGIRLIDNVPI